MTETLYSDILSSCLSIIMGGLSITVAIFTLATAFIISKRDVRNELERQINEGGVSLTLTRRVKATNTFIKRMRKVTNNSITATIILTTGLIAYIVFRVLQPSWWICILVAIVGTGIIYTLIVIVILFIWYHKTTNA